MIGDVTILYLLPTFFLNLADMHNILHINPSICYIIWWAFHSCTISQYISSKKLPQTACCFSPLPRFKSDFGYLRKLPGYTSFSFRLQLALAEKVTIIKIQNWIFIRYSSLLLHLQLALEEKATIINIWNQVFIRYSSFPLHLQLALEEKATIIKI